MLGPAASLPIFPAEEQSTSSCPQSATLNLRWPLPADLLKLAARRLVHVLRLLHQMLAQLRGGQADEVAQTSRILPTILAMVDDLAQSEPRVVLGPMHIWRMRLLEVAFR